MLTRVQREILQELERRGGEAVSLGRLATDLNLEYSNAHKKIHELQELGIVNLRRERKGLRMILVVCDGVKFG